MLLLATSHIVVVKNAGRWEWGVYLCVSRGEVGLRMKPESKVPGQTIYPVILYWPSTSCGHITTIFELAGSPHIFLSQTDICFEPTGSHNA